MNPEFNKWFPPEVAKEWPEGSQIVWRIKCYDIHYRKRHHYDVDGWFRPDLIGVKYPRNQKWLEFMLLELPIKERRR